MYRIILILAVLGAGYETAQAQTVTALRSFGGNLGSVVGIVVDGSDIYVSGSFHGIPLPAVAKYSTAGQQYWEKTFLIPAATATLSGPATQAGGLAVTATGIYVAAAGRSSRGDADIFIRKYDSAGTALWVQQLESPGQDFAAGVAGDETGVYVTGMLGSAGIIRKYDPAGKELWTRSISTEALNSVMRPSVAADGSGVYVAGKADLTKYDTLGTELWRRRIGDDVVATALTLYSDNLYVAGRRGTFPANAASSFLHSYSAAGETQWVRQFGPDWPRAVAVDDTGIYVGGTISGTLPGNCRFGDSDSAVRKFDPAGGDVWARQFSFSTPESLQSIAVDGTAVYTAGTSLAKLGKTPVVFDSSKPHVLDGCVVNAASIRAGAIAPGERVIVIGSGLGPNVPASQQVTEAGMLATELADTSVFFAGIPAPLLTVSDTRSSAIVPYEIAGRPSVDVQVEYQGVRSDTITLPVVSARPGIFTRDGSGAGQADAINEDGSLNSPTNPASRGSIITLYVTGEGLISPPLPAGTIVGPIAPRPTLGIEVLFDTGSEWVDGEVLSTEETVGSASGLLQIRVRVPAYANTGDAIPIFVSVSSSPVGAQSGFDVWVAIKETTAVAAVQLTPPVVTTGNSYTASISGTNLSGSTYLDLRYRSPDSNTDQVVLNWQIGTSADHLVTAGTAAGIWNITGARAHSNIDDHSGGFSEVSAALAVLPAQ